VALQYQLILLVMLAATLLLVHWLLLMVVLEVEQIAVLLEVAVDN
jgi:hypothetical protein